MNLLVYEDQCSYLLESKLNLHLMLVLFESADFGSVSVVEMAEMDDRESRGNDFQ